MSAYGSKPLAFVMAHLGLNCEFETKRALEIAGAEVKLLSLFELKKNPKKLLQAQILAIPGGFSFGDEVAAGVLAAQYIQAHANQEWFQFLEKRPPVIGICNGFQILCQLNAFGTHAHDPAQAGSELVLATNITNVFSSEWKEMKVSNIESPWLASLSQGETIALPVRHKSGRLLALNNSLKNHQCKVALTYLEDWNGSTEKAAAITNHAGNILGLMPHPEGAVEAWQLPEKYENQTAFGLKLFKSAVESV